MCLNTDRATFLAAELPVAAMLEERGIFSILSSFHASLQVIVAMLQWEQIHTKQKTVHDQVKKNPPKTLTDRLGKNDDDDNERTLLLDPRQMV